MADTDELHQEEVDEQNRRILQDLRRMYPSAAEVSRPLARVEQRLFHASDAPPRARSSRVNLKRAAATTFRKRMWQRRFGTLATGAVAALLVGAFVLILNQAHQGRTGRPGNLSHQPGAFASLRMIDATTGWALAGKAVLHTTDGGMQWNDITPPGYSINPGSVMDALTASQAWVAIPQSGYTTRIFRTVDGGQTWQSSTIPNDQTGTRVAQITFVNAQDGWILANRGGAASAEIVNIYRTTDGGRTWISVSRALAASTDGPPPGHLPFGGAKSGIHFLNASTGWVTGTVLLPGLAWLYVSHDGGSTWNRQTLPLPPGVPPAQLLLRPPMFFSATDGILPVSFSNNETGIATVIYTTHDGGTTWQATTPVPVALSAVDFLDMQHGWVTDGSILYATSNGGHHWTKIVPGTGFKHITQLDFISSTVGWAIGGQGTGAPFLFKTVDGGQTWTPITSAVP
ncbi:MAG: WD40/YVTN/BNR-like repeat-containing protein [Ktedonobacteraceae bacterium]